jgi:hypothetical protein
MRTLTLVLTAAALIAIQVLTPTVAAQGSSTAGGGTQAPVGQTPAAPAQTTPTAPAAPAGAAPDATPVMLFPATMKELMVDLIFPTSNALFYVSREEPKNGVEWAQLELTFLTLAESANVLMAAPRARDQGQWMDDARLLLNVGVKAYRNAKAKNYNALVELNDELYESCQSCHVHYRPGYRRRP